VRSHGEGGGGGRGGGASAAVRSARWPATTSGRWARAAALPHEQGMGRARAMRFERLTHGPERDGGPGVSGGVRERAGERGQAAMGCQQVGPGNTVPLRQFKRYFEPIQNIQTVHMDSKIPQTLTDSKCIFPCSKNCKAFEIRNNFTYKDFLIFGMDFELKFREASVS
jgi:hypothetical protein